MEPAAQQTKFARDWRNRHVAHSDLRPALNAVETHYCGIAYSVRLRQVTRRRRDALARSPEGEF
jgi:hypothetical protein